MIRFGTKRKAHMQSKSAGSRQGDACPVCGAVGSAPCVSVAKGKSGEALKGHHSARKG